MVTLLCRQLTKPCQGSDSYVIYWPLEQWRPEKIKLGVQPCLSPVWLCLTIFVQYLLALFSLRVLILMGFIDLAVRSIEVFITTMAEAVVSE